MNCSFCASAGAAVATAPNSTASAIPACFPVIGIPPLTRRTRRLPADHCGVLPRLWAQVCPRIAAPSIRERPQPKLLLADRPQPGQPERLGDQEQHDDSPEQHELEVRDRV